MYPFGLAETFTYSRVKKDVVFDDDDGEPFYKENPFTQILRSRGRIQRTDLSDLKNLPTAASKFSDNFAKVGSYRETLVVLKSQEDPNKPLDAPDQPPYFRVPLSALRKSSCLFASMLDEKDKKKYHFTDNSIVYSFDQSPTPNLHIQ